MDLFAMTTCSKALSPAHPSEKKAAVAFANPPCELGVPLYPLRYGVADEPCDAASFPMLSTAGYPALKGGKSYGARVLRPGCYVYLFYFKDGRMWTQQYRVTSNARFAQIWWTKADYQEVAPGRLSRPDEAGAKDYLLAPLTETADTVYLVVSDTALTHRTLWKIEANQDGLRDKLATRCKPAGGVSQPHCFDAALLGKATSELLPDAMFGRPAPIAWSEIRFADGAPDGCDILGNMHIALRPRMDIKPVAVVLQDPVGIASELHHLVSNAVGEKTTYAGQNAHKLQSGKLITDYFKGMEERAATSPDVAAAVARQRALVDYAGATAFEGVYSKKIDALDKIIATAVEDVIAWVKLIEAPRLLGQALSCYDLGVLHIARDYEDTVFQCIGGLVHSKQGLEVLSGLVDKPVGQSPYWLALANGNETLLERLKSNAGDIAKNTFAVLNAYMEEHHVTPATNALVGLAQALPDEKRTDILIRRLRHVMEIRANVTIVKYDVSLTEWQRAAYEFQGYQTLGEERLRGWKMPSRTVIQVDEVRRVAVYDWVKIGETTYRDLGAAPADRPALPPSRAMHMKGNPFIDGINRMRGPAGHLFAGLGGFLALTNTRAALKELKACRERAQLISLINVVGAGYALMGASLEIRLSLEALLPPRPGLKVLDAIAKRVAMQRAASFFGAYAAATQAIADGVKSANAFDDNNSSQASMYMVSAVANGVVAGATLFAGMAAAATNVPGVAAVVLGLGPVGWLVIAAIAFAVVIKYTAEAEKAQHGPVEIWLRHSAWGVNSRRYSIREELDAVHSLHYRPRLTADWDQPFDASTNGLPPIGTLRISCQLPGITDIPGERFQARLSVSLRGRELHVNKPIVYVNGHSRTNFRCEYLVEPLGRTGVECGWKIVMHEDAKVALEYIFFPDPEQQPGLALLQPDAPAPLVFSSQGWFSDPIDAAKLEPVKEPSAP